MKPSWAMWLVMGAFTGFCAVVVAAWFALPRASDHPRIERTAWMWTPKTGDFRGVPFAAPLARPHLMSRADGTVLAVAESDWSAPQRFDPQSEKFVAPAPADHGSQLDDGEPRPAPLANMMAATFLLGDGRWIGFDVSSAPTTTIEIVSNGRPTRGPSLPTDVVFRVTFAGVVDDGRLVLFTGDSIEVARPDEASFRQARLSPPFADHVYAVASAGARLLVVYERAEDAFMSTRSVDVDTGEVYGAPVPPAPSESGGDRSVAFAHLADGRLLVVEDATLHSWNPANLTRNVASGVVLAVALAASIVHVAKSKGSWGGWLAGVAIGAGAGGGLVAFVEWLFSSHW